LKFNRSGRTGSRRRGGGLSAERQGRDEERRKQRKEVREFHSIGLGLTQTGLPQKTGVARP